MATWDGPDAHRRRMQVAWGLVIARLMLLAYLRAGRLATVGGLIALLLTSVASSFMTTAIRVAQDAGVPVAVLPVRPSAQTLPTPAASNRQVRPTAGVIRPSASWGSRPSGASWGSRSQYVVSFGRFPQRQVAEAHARLVRTKGYAATVTRVGSSFTVVSRPYPDKGRAEFWAGVFRHVGLQAEIAGLPTSNPAN